MSIDLKEAGERVIIHLVCPPKHQCPQRAESTSIVSILLTLLLVGIYLGRDSICRRVSVSREHEDLGNSKDCQKEGISPTSFHSLHTRRTLVLVNVGGRKEKTCCNIYAVSLLLSTF